MQRAWIPVTIVSLIFSPNPLRADSSLPLPPPHEETLKTAPPSEQDPSEVAGHALNPEFAKEPASTPSKQVQEPAPASPSATQQGPASAPNAVQENTPADQNVLPPEQGEPTVDEAPIKYVSEEQPEHMKKKKVKYWQNILIAATAVAIAVVALILVSQNNGKNASHHHRNH